MARYRLTVKEPRVVMVRRVSVPNPSLPATCSRKRSAKDASQEIAHIHNWGNDQKEDTRSPANATSCLRWHRR